MPSFAFGNLTGIKLRWEEGTMNQEVTQSRIHNDDIRMLLWAYYWRMLKLWFLGPSFLSVYISGWSRISFLSHLKIKSLLWNVVVISQKVSHTSAAFPGRLKKQQHTLQIKAEAVAQRSLHFSKNSYFFVLAELSSRSSSLWYGIQIPRTIARTY